jgi:hypothetical protein
VYGFAHCLSDGDSIDINSVDLFFGLRVLWEIIPESTDAALQAPQYIKLLDGSFPKTEVAKRIMLTVPVTVASRERSFSKLKIIENYMRTTITKDRLGGLALLSIKKVAASSINCNDLIADFAARKSRKVDFVWASDHDG